MSSIHSRRENSRITNLKEIQNELTQAIKVINKQTHQRELKSGFHIMTLGRGATTPRSRRHRRRRRPILILLMSGLNEVETDVTVSVLMTDVFID